MKGYGLAALGPLATVYRPAPSGGIGDTGVPGRGMKAIATGNLRIELPDFDPENLLNGLRGFLGFCSSWVSNTLMSGPNAHSLKRHAKKNSFRSRLRRLSGLPEKTGANVSSLQNRPECPNGD